MNTDAPGDPEVDAMLDTIMVMEPDRSETTSAQVASTAAKLLGMSNVLMSGSPYRGAILAAIKNKSSLRANADVLDLIDELAQVIEPFMKDVRTVAGSALTQFAPVVDEPHD